MPQEITRTAYTITELSEEARQKALEKHYNFNTFDSFWYEDMLEDYDEDYGFVAQARKQGFEITTHSVKLMNGEYRQKPNIYFSGFWNQGDGASFEADVDVEKYIKAHKRGRKYAMILRAMRDDWSVYATVNKASYPHYSHSGLMSATVETDFAPSYDAETDYAYERAVEREDKFEALMEELRDEIEEDARDLADDFYRQLEREYEYLTSEEQLIESLEANEMLFNEDGTDF